MRRKITSLFIRWKNNPNKLPLIVKGTRQIGKTYSIKEFAIENGEDIVGYQYLHGVNSDLNLYKSFGATTNDIGFQIQGTIIKDKKGNVHTVNS